MQKHIVDEKTGIPYTLVGDYYLPWGDLPNDEPEQKSIGIWGQRHRRYLKQNHRLRYMNLITSGNLNSYLADIDGQAEEMFSRLVKQMAEKRDITEKLKAVDQMRWVQEMNNMRNSASEIVYTEMIYC
jgi:hypothetical protein